MGVSKRGSVWYVKWKDAYGRWKRQRTSARTKAEAQHLWAELMRQADRRRRGLELEPMEVGLTFWGLCEWWLDNRCPKASLRRAKNSLDKHVRRSALGGIALHRVGAPLLDGYFDDMAKKGYRPRTINQVRLLFGAAFSQGARASLCSPINPVRLTRVREVVNSPRPTLTEEERELVLAHVRPDWRGFFATAAYLGLRKGELCGLRKADYNPARQTLYVGRSYLAEQTKGKRVDTLPVPSALVPYLEGAMESPGPYLFPGPTGRMRNDEASPEDILRSAMRRAGLTEGWLHKCRRCKRYGRKTPPVEAADDSARKCGRCGFTLWPVAKVRDIRFHDLRHTAATHLLQSGVAVQHVQRILRHSSIRTTVDTYGHLLTEDLRNAVEKLGPRPVQTSRPPGIGLAKGGRNQ